MKKNYFKKIRKRFFIHYFMKKIFLYLTFFCFWYINIFAQKTNQSIFPLYKQCNNPIEIFAETEKLDYSSENATIKTTQITSKGKGFLHMKTDNKNKVIRTRVKLDRQLWLQEFQFKYIEFVENTKKRFDTYAKEYASLTVSSETNLSNFMV